MPCWESWCMRQPFSAAAHPRLAGAKSLHVLTAVVASNEKVNLTCCVAGARYALGLEQTLLRCQLVAVWSQCTDRWYLATLVELH